jgi:monofunctional biosynthetic peptidoglycan transglycosylase
MKKDLMDEELLENKKKPRMWWLVYGAGGILLLALAVILVAVLSVPEISALQKSNPQKTSLMQQRLDEATRTGKKYRIRQQWVNFNDIPELLKKSVRISEDAAFYDHEGIDLDELKESLKKNWIEGRLARGGSTITQQLAKNLFLGTEKSIWRKIREYYIARELEDKLSKNRIFHLYLNVIELGPGVFGVGAAAEYYFYKPVTYLSDEEIIRLTAVIPKPLSENPHHDSRWLNWRCRWITDKLRLYHYIDQELYDKLVSVFTGMKP